MATPQTEHGTAIYDRRERERAREERRGGVQPAPKKAAVAGGATAALIAAGAVALGVLGIMGLLPRVLAAIATIALGVALWSEGTALTAKRVKGLRTNGRAYERVSTGGSISVYVVGGVAGIGLGVLALLGLIPLVLLAIAMIALGGALFLGGAGRSEVSGEVAHEPTGLGGILGLAGLASAVLGILALVGTATPMNLILISTIVVGGALLVGGSSLAMRA